MTCFLHQNFEDGYVAKEMLILKQVLQAFFSQKVNNYQGLEKENVLFDLQQPSCLPRPNLKANKLRVGNDRLWKRPLNG